MHDILDPAHSYVDILRAAARGEAPLPLWQGEPAQIVPLPERLVLGRGRGCGLVLRQRLISRRHSLLTRHDGFWLLRDLKSASGTYLNGKAVLRARVRPGDLIQLGPYLFQFRGQALHLLRQPAPLTLAGLNLGQEASGVTLLDDVTFVARPGEFIGIIGPSGAGKSTLLDALAGLRPPSAGRVVLNGMEADGSWRHLVGYVPQDEIVHPELTCRQAIAYAARLRLPADVPAEELQAAVDEMLDTLELTERAHVSIDRLSGGQRKRVSIGVELVGRPRLLFLDEPTSGLDPGTEAKMMRLFRTLAHQGRTVICTTHVMENIDLFDQVAVLAVGGRLAYFGPPAAARAYFQVDRLTGIYERLEERPGAAWQVHFRGSVHYRRLTHRAAAERTPGEFHRPIGDPRQPPSASAQWLLLVARWCRIQLGSWRALALLVLQPLAIGGLVCAVFRELPTVFFLLAISAVWFGCSQAAQQIVRERAVFRRERRSGLSLAAYLLSKFVPLALIATGQAALMLGLVWLFKEPDGERWLQLLAVALAGCNGVALGLIISALAANADRATAVVPLVILPQIILGGVMVALPDMNAPMRVAADVTPARWANQALTATLFEGREVKAELLDDAADARALWNLYPDYDLREPGERVRFLDDYREERVELRGPMMLACGALVAMILVQLGVALGRLGNEMSSRRPG